MKTCCTNATTSAKALAHCSPFFVSCAPLDSDDANMKRTLTLTRWHKVAERINGALKEAEARAVTAFTAALISPWNKEGIEQKAAGIATRGKADLALVEQGSAAVAAIRSALAERAGARLATAVQALRTSSRGPDGIASGSAAARLRRHSRQGKAALHCRGTRGAGPQLRADGGNLSRGDFPHLAGAA
jgi:hypothetical protein